MTPARVQVMPGDCEDSWRAVCPAAGCGWQIPAPSRADARAWGMWHAERCPHRTPTGAASAVVAAGGYATWRHVAVAGGRWHRPSDPVQPLWWWLGERVEMVCGAAQVVVDVTEQTPVGPRCPACYYEEPACP